MGDSAVKMNSLKVGMVNKLIAWRVDQVASYFKLAPAASSCISAVMACWRACCTVI